MCLTCVGSQLSINSSSASSFSGPLQLWNTQQRRSHIRKHHVEHKGLIVPTVLQRIVGNGVTPTKAKSWTSARVGNGGPPILRTPKPTN
uniref:Uncharacterized protein n=1 Tax=Gadus morhua TaxID=8049 RepID=A0A8C5CDF7_GADMO